MKGTLTSTLFLLTENINVMGKDLFKNAGSKFIGPGGIKCPCCDKGLSKKRKTKIGRNLFSRMRRSILKRETKNEINRELVEE
jgi:hypothetical protein